MVVSDLGLIPYGEAFALQERLVALVAAGGEERLLLMEHPPVYTMGRGGDGGNVLDPGVEPLRVNRGGDVTYHGPGQLVGYPIVHLERRGRDLHRYLRFLEELLIRVAAHFGVEAHRVPGRTGVWTGRGKIASIGVGVRRWVSMHGFALNVADDLDRFSLINPCGISGCPLTSLEGMLGAALSMAEVKAEVGAWFEPLLREWMPECGIGNN